MSLSYTANSLEDITKMFERRAHAAWLAHNRAAMHREQDKLLTEQRTYLAAAEVLRNTVIEVAPRPDQIPGSLTLDPTLPEAAL